MKKVLSVFLSLVFVLLLCSCDFFGDGKQEYVTKTEFVFGASQLYLKVTAPKGKSFDKAFDQILDELEKVDAQINVSENKNSGILAFNLSGANTETEIGFYAYDMIVLAKEMYQETDGAFNIAAYPLTYLWAVDALALTDFTAGLHPSQWRTPASFAGSDIVRNLPLPDADEVERVKAMCDLDGLSVQELDGKYFASKTSADLKIDLGGIAKGYCADLAAKFLRQNGITSAKIDLSGNLAFVGKKDNTTGWNVGISDGGQDIFAAITAEKDQTVVTSGDYERLRGVGTLVGGLLRLSHIINVDSALPYGIYKDDIGYKNNPARVVSASIIGDNSAMADILATAACVKGLEDAMEFLQDFDVKAVLVTDDKRYGLVGDVDFVLTGDYGAFRDFTQVFLTNDR